MFKILNYEGEESESLTIAEANQPFAESISEAIRSKGMKQISVAKQAGLTGQQFSDMLNGRKLIRICDAVKLCQVVEVSFDDMIRWKESEQNGQEKA